MTSIELKGYFGGSCKASEEEYRYECSRYVNVGRTNVSHTNVSHTNVRLECQPVEDVDYVKCLWLQLAADGGYEMYLAQIMDEEDKLQGALKRVHAE